MAKKKSKDPEDNAIALSHTDHVQLLNLQHAEDVAVMQQALAREFNRAVRLEIAQAAQEAAQRTSVAENQHAKASSARATFAQALAERYAFSWSTHTYCPETGRVRQVLED